MSPGRSWFLVPIILLLGLAVAASAMRLPAAPPAVRPSTATVALPTLTRQGLMVPMGEINGPDGLQVGYPSVLIDQGMFKMWYFEVSANPWYAQIAYATSPDGYVWTKRGTVLSPTLPSEFNDVAYPSVVHLNGMYWMWYNGWDGATYRIFAATSPDGTNWTKLGVVLDIGPAGSLDATSLGYPFVLYTNGTFYMWYTGLTSFSPPDNAAILLATSRNGVNWTKDGLALAPGANGTLDSYNVFTASVVLQGSTFVMVYHGQSADVTSRMFYAISSDGLHWEKMGIALAPDPPREKTVGQPSVVIAQDGTWFVYYAVRNYTSDIQIYLATGAPAQPVLPPPQPVPPPTPQPTPQPPAPVTPPTAGGSASSSGLASGALWSPALAFVALTEALGAAVGVALGVVVLGDRPRHR